MIAAMALNQNRSDVMNVYAESFSYITWAQLPVASNAGCLLRSSLEKRTAANFPIGEVLIIPTSNLPAGAIQTNATLLAETQFTFWILKSRSPGNLVISFVTHVGADALVAALQLAIGVDVSIDRYSLFEVNNVLRVSLAGEIAAYDLHHIPQNIDDCEH